MVLLLLRLEPDPARHPVLSSGSAAFRHAAEPPSRTKRSGAGERRLGARSAQAVGQRVTLALGERAHRSQLGDRHRGQHLAALGRSPPPLAHEQVGDRHSLRLARTAEDDLGGGDPSLRDAPLELRAGQADVVGPLQRVEVLRTRRVAWCFLHLDSPANRSVEMGAGSRRGELAAIPPHIYCLTDPCPHHTSRPATGTLDEPSGAGQRGTLLPLAPSGLFRASSACEQMDKRCAARGGRR